MNTTLNTQPVGYKAKAFEARNLIFFFLIAFLPVFVVVLVACRHPGFPIQSRTRSEAYFS